MTNKAFCTYVRRAREEDLARTEVRRATPGVQPEIEFDVPPSGQLIKPPAVRQLRGLLREHTLLHWQSTIGNHAVQRAIDHSRSSAAAIDDLAQRIRAASLGGRPIDTSARERLEASLDADLSAVKIHTDAEADHLSQALDARAFATGQHIFFREAQYQPNTIGGLHLLAHEATHTIQASGATENATATLTISEPADHNERVAEAIANAVVDNSLSDAHVAAFKSETISPTLSKMPIQRQPQDKELLDYSLYTVPSGLLKDWGASIGTMGDEDWRLKIGGPLGGGWNAQGSVGSQGWNVGAGGPLGAWNLEGNVGSQGWNIGASGPVGGGINAQASAGSKGVNFGLGGTLPYSTELGGIQIGPPTLAGTAGSQGAEIGMNLPIGAAAANFGIGTQGVRGGLSLPLGENLSLGANAMYNWDQSYSFYGSLGGRF